MKRYSMFLYVLAFFVSSPLVMLAANDQLAHNGDDPAPPSKSDTIMASPQLFRSPNVIHYSYEKGDALFLETVDEFERPLSCILSINQERRYHFVPEDGIISFERDTKVDRISVFHDAKVYDFIPEPSDHNKLTLVLDTESQRFDLFEDRLHKINYTRPKSKRNKATKLVDNRYPYPGGLPPLEEELQVWGMGF
ncbi:MAG: hypothetical protein AAFW73_16385 [Bacteroidota bacterium]